MAPKTDYDFYKPIAQAIKKTRSEARPKISQEVLADKTGLSRAAIANIERGRQQILVHVLYKIAKALNISPSDLIPSLNSQPEKKKGESQGISQAVVNDLKKQVTPRNFEIIMKRISK
jgi:transcriptional regulator with XRE-family HTH domain